MFLEHERVVVPACNLVPTQGMAKDAAMCEQDPMEVLKVDSVVVGNLFDADGVELSDEDEDFNSVSKTFHSVTLMFSHLLRDTRVLTNHAT